MYNDIKATWVYNHPHAILTISLAVALVGSVWDIHMPANEVIAYTAPCDTLDCIIERDTMLYFEENRDMYIEDARTVVLSRYGDSIINKLQTKP